MVETGTGGAGLEPVIMLVQEKMSPRVDEELAELGLVGEVGGIEGLVAVSETGPPDMFFRPFDLA